MTWDKAKLAPIVLIKAGEEVLAERARDSLVAQGRKNGLTPAYVDASSYNAGDLAMHLSPSLFGGGSLVVATRLKDMNEDFLNDALSVVSDAGFDGALIAIHEGGNRGLKLLKAIDAAGFPTVVIEPVKRDADKAGLVRADVKRAGSVIDDDAVGALVDALGGYLRELLAATAQLVADTTGPITAKVVHTYYSGRIEASGFAIADAAIAGREGRALSLARHALATGGEPVPIVASLAIKVRQLAQVADMNERPDAPRPSLAPWQINNARRELSAWSTDQLALAIRAVAVADGDVKGFGGAKDPAFALERCIREICAARRRR